MRVLHSEGKSLREIGKQVASEFKFDLPPMSIKRIMERPSIVATALGPHRASQRPRIEGYRRTSTPR
jgi:hypothetical protein